jgi:hypothetical protein
VACHSELDIEVIYTWFIAMHHFFEIKKMAHMARSAPAEKKLYTKMDIFNLYNYGQ